jgi:F0F1-type ATP synthase membrane subunit c/vacuolar-type H+-ATPase subunit K
MNPIDPTALEAKVDARYRTLLILWAAMLTSIAVYAFVAFFAAPAAGAGSPVILLALVGAGLLPLAASFFLKLIFLAQAARQRNPNLVHTAHIIAFALCDATAILGLVACFITRNTYSWALFVLAAAGMLLHVPRRAQILDALYGNQP